MSQINQGQQQIGWKYQTPLKAEYLNSFLAGLSTPGLLTRPKFTLGPLAVGQTVTIQPFSLLVNPEGIDNSSSEDENGDEVYFKLVKVTTTSSMIVNIAPFTCALGFKYSFTTDDQQLQQQWYGEVIPLDMEKLQTFKGIIIATCQMYTSESTDYYSVSTSGADISDALLIKEGWNPSKWLSVIHPTRADNGTSNKIYNKLEVRSHNKRFSGYVNGFGGLAKMSDLVYEMNTDVDPVTNPDGIRGFMPDNYNAFKLQSDEFGLSNSVAELPIDHTPGAVFALVDAFEVNKRRLGDSFINKLGIYPVQTANTNSFYDNDTLYII